MAANAEKTDTAAVPVGLEQGTYEVIRSRLAAHGAELKTRLDRLNQARQEVFGTIQTALLATDRITTRNKCVPRDMVALGKSQFVFGYNVQIGLRGQTSLSDVFAVYELRGHEFRELPMDLLNVPEFVEDFSNLYRYFRNTTFAKFSQIGPHLFMVFQVGKTSEDIKTFKWLIQESGLQYLGNRSDHEFRFPPQHEFEWIRTHRELHRFGLHPHISVEDRVFVETVGGDLTIKVEDNTATGQGIYSEPVDNVDQTLDDAEVYYAAVGNLILLKIRPYQEKRFRHLIFNEKLQQVRRIDAIEDACVLLPDNHGIIFSSGCYLQTGEFKTFDTPFTGVKFDGRLAAPNGEDFLYRFYHPETGNYALLSYNLIEQRVQTPLICGGFSVFDNGELALFRSDDEPQKHHTIQIWQTPYASSTAAAPVLKKDSFLYKIGNADLVGGMAECREVISLLGKEDTYANLYLDILKKASDILDSYFWIGNEEAFNLQVPLREIRAAASSAVDEFEKVKRIRRSTADQVQATTQRARQLVANIPYNRLNEIGMFVQNLAALRIVRGELISLKELRYADLPGIEACEKEVAEQIAKLSNLAVQFLLTEGALDPYRVRSQELQQGVPGLGKFSEVRRVEEEANTLAKDLEMLIEVVGNLKIDDATQTTRIIENISAIYSVLNQARAALRQKSKELRSAEATAEFASQNRLLAQALTNYLDLSQSPDKCEEFLTRLMVQIEELEGRFADFDEFVVQLSEKRTEICNAFETRKLELVEALNRKTNGLLTAGDRILKGINHRVETLNTADEINGYFASDLLVEKVRDLIRQLIELGDSGKADDLQSRLKTIRENTLRQLKDRQELFVEGQNLIQFGAHRFSVNTQELAPTVVLREGQMWLHLAGTRFFEKMEDPELLAIRSVWEQQVVSENCEVYRAEYLAWKAFQTLQDEGKLETASKWTDAERFGFLQAFLSPRYAEGYVKGVHDHDAARILSGLIGMHLTLGLLRYSATARACAAAFWHQFPAGPERDLVLGKLRGFGTMKQLFPGPRRQSSYIGELQQLLAEFSRTTGLFDDQWGPEAAEYLYYQVKQGDEFVASPEAADLFAKFQTHLSAKRFQEAFEAARAAVKESFAGTFELLRDWMRGFITASNQPEALEYLDEATVLLLKAGCSRSAIIRTAVAQRLEKMVGDHPVLNAGNYTLHFIRFTRKLREFETVTVPQFERCQALKKQWLTRRSEELRLESFKPKVLTSFVRNRLIDSVYLPLIGSNLAKQIGAAGEGKRTDLMGMLLLISPPGYGKTTLLEYIAHRLGQVFVKINGPALGTKVVSLDPAEAPNAAARDEIEKLNLAFEMGDNVMVCIDDIQHCEAEFLQKFISLCDAQRRIEGVYRGKPRTYDLRGRKVAIAMAGNPYTESGDKFQIPDMLANRADTYNLGDIIGNSVHAFKMSYLENAMTSNPVLARIAAHHPADIYPIIQLAEAGTRDGLEFAGGYSAEELNQLVSVMRHLLRVREVILKVNAEYIRSAAQAEAYRTEPPFKLQGSYRNMNRLAEKVMPVMNAQEVDDLIFQHYKDEAQTLTKGTEANLLKFKELVGTLTPVEAKRWEEIKRTFKKNLLMRTGDGQDPIGLVVGQLAAFNEGLESIKDVLDRPPEPPVKPVTIFLVSGAEPNRAPASAAAPAASPPEEGVREVSITPETLKKIWDLVAQQNAAKEANSSGTDSPRSG